MSALDEARVRLGEAIRSHRDAILDGLVELEWAADRSRPHALVRGRDAVRPRAELFLDTLTAGLVEGDWKLWEETVGARAGELLGAGVISALDLDARALTLATMLIPLARQDREPDQALAALFESMQTLSSHIVSRYSRTLLMESRRLDDLKTMVLRMTGHELRTPLGTIRGYVSMLLDGDFGPLSAGIEGPLGVIDAAAGSALGMIDRLVEIARLESGGEVLHRERHSLAGIVELALDPLREPAARAGVELRVEVDGGEALVDADEVAIAIRNLVGNALKYAADARVVWVRARRAAGDAVFEVADRGPGIAEGDRERVFERYFRSEPARGSGISGSGLGLYIVRRIAELHGGEASVAGGEGEGATFRLRLPAD